MITAGSGKARPLQNISGEGPLTPLADRRRIAVVVKAVARATDAWGLTHLEGAALFDVPVATWSRMKAGSYRGTLDRDKVTRASLIIGLFSGLGSLFNGPLARGWPKAPNAGPGFEGRTPVEVMCEGGIPAMMKVRQHIDALRGGA